MKAIVRKQQERRLGESDKAKLGFRVRGNEVEPHKIERWMKEKGISENEAYAPSPAARKRIEKRNTCNLCPDLL
jgi:hypothetical protein